MTFILNSVYWTLGSGENGGEQDRSLPCGACLLEAPSQSWPLPGGKALSLCGPYSPAAHLGLWPASDPQFTLELWPHTAPYPQLPIVPWDYELIPGYHGCLCSEPLPPSSSLNSSIHSTSSLSLFLISQLIFCVCGCARSSLLWSSFV